MKGEGSAGRSCGGGRITIGGGCEVMAREKEQKTKEMNDNILTFSHFGKPFLRRVDVIKVQYSALFSLLSIHQMFLMIILLFLRHLRRAPSILQL